MSSHQPLLLMSCRRRTATPIEGIKTAKPKIPERIVPTLGIKLRMMLTMAYAKVNHQYSGRVARPSKLT